MKILVGIKKLLFVGAVLLVVGFVQPSFAGIMIPSNPNGRSELDELSNPDACEYVRRDREGYCHRWYGLEAKARPIVQAKKITIDQVIHFDFNKSNIKPESNGILDDVASVLNANPKIGRVRVEGHTDAIGSEAYNMKLSQSRADSVQNYLTGKGVSSARLEAVGYGKTRPIAPNNTAEGRAKNRRVEFNVVE